MPFLTPSPTQTQVNTTTALSQSGAIIWPLSNGRYIVVWTDAIDQTLSGASQFANSNVRAQIFNADGSAFGSEFVVTDDPGTQVIRAVTQLSDGNILIAWQNNLSTGLASPAALPATSAREFTIDGVATGNAFPIGSTTIATQNVSISALSGGGFAATWYSGTNIGSIVSQIFDNNNTAVGSAITVDTTNVAIVGRPVVATLSNGNFLILYTQAFGSTFEVTGQIYTSAGVAVGSAMQLASNFGQIYAVQARPLSDGGFAMMVTLHDQGPNHVVSRITTFDSAGSGVDYFEVQRDVLSASVSVPILSVIPDSGFVVTWTENDSTANGAISDGSGTTIVAALYALDGTPIYPDPLPDFNDPNLTNALRGGAHAFQVNANGTSNQTIPFVAVLDNGNVVISWVDNEATDGSGSSIQQRVFTLDPTNRAPTAVHDSFIATDGVYDAIDLTDNDFEPDGQALIVTNISNVTGGIVDFNLIGQQFQVTRTPGSNGLVEFDYTIMDEGGATATAHARLSPDPVDNVTIRGNFALIDFLANDFLETRPDGYAFTLNPLNGLPTNPLMSYFVIGSGTSATISTSVGYDGTNRTGYGFLPVGQTMTQTVLYTIRNPVTNVIENTLPINITLEGWTQFGGTGADNLTGGASADHLVGGTGAANVLTGGNGNDWYTVEAVGDVIVELPNEGRDAIYTTLNAMVMAANVEDLFYIGDTNLAFDARGNAENNTIVGRNGNDILRGFDGNDTLSGNGGADFLIGGAGADTLRGGAGNDVLYGGADIDRLEGGTDNDSYFVGTGDVIVEAAGAGTDIAYADSSYVLGAGVQIEALGTIDETATTAIDLTGNELNNYLSGNAGANVLDGGTGVDILWGRGGDDIYFADANDLVVEYAGQGNDRINARESFILYDGIEVETLAAADAASTVALNLTGNSANNRIIGNAGANILIGGGGADSLEGGAGNDSYFVDSSDSVLDAVGGGYDIVYASGHFTLGAEVEAEILGTVDNSASTAINLTGNELNNYLTGNGGVNILNGAGGSDYLGGRGGNDIFVFGTSAGADTILDFTRGQDRIDLSALGLSFAQVQAGYVQTGANGVIDLGGGNSVTLLNITLSELVEADFVLTAAAEAPSKGGSASEAMDVAKAFDSGDADLGSYFVDATFADTSIAHWSIPRLEVFV